MLMRNNVGSLYFGILINLLSLMPIYAKLVGSFLKIFFIFSGILGKNDTIKYLRLTL